MQFPAVMPGAVPLERFAVSPIAKHAPGTEASKATLELIALSDISATLDANDFVEGLLSRGGLSILYGESNCGKSFFATDLALHVALGWRWRDREVEKGGVLYVAAEGGFGAKNRVAAFTQNHGFSDAAPFYLSRQPIDLLNDSTAANAIVEATKAISAASNIPTTLIVVDTLSRVLAGGNENSPDDMGAIVKAADEIRAATGAHLMFVHHSGKEATKGPRGHSLLRAAADTEIHLTRDSALDLSRAKVTKQRDLETTGEFAFELVTVELGQNARGKPVTSCVLECRESAPNGSSTRLSNLEYLALQELDIALLDHGEERIPEEGMPVVLSTELRLWKDRLEQTEILEEDAPDRARKRWGRMRQGLQTKGHIRIWNDQVWKT
ncbi:helicase RepA family protein [Minwuia sp. IMCC3009]|uniref:helicase RepA family protein n=1 Tax=Minwuia sp. IMCC3009 TaxID=3040674 RepID=UPI0024783A9E|nr:helicase RepA family protein [Minwuia sp. IMCC3009]